MTSAAIGPRFSLTWSAHRGGAYDAGCKLYCVRLHQLIPDDLNCVLYSKDTSWLLLLSTCRCLQLLQVLLFERNVAGLLVLLFFFL